MIAGGAKDSDATHTEYCKQVAHVPCIILRYEPLEDTIRSHDRLRDVLEAENMAHPLEKKVARRWPEGTGEPHGPVATGAVVDVLGWERYALCVLHFDVRLQTGPGKDIPVVD